MTAALRAFMDRGRLLILVSLLAVFATCRADTDQAITAYWEAPIPPQSPTPPAPETCGACHSDKYSEWQGSRHAHAFSPGLLGQIIDYDPVDAASCLNCHAPLAEQQDFLLQGDLESLAANMETQLPGTLAQHGVYCAACHLRDGILHAPSITPTDSRTRVHRDIKTEPLMQDSRFCSGCHQFDASTSINGKPLQNTYREWLDSTYAGQGKTCQHCHMPDRAHLFRGIHDPDTVRQGLTITTQFDQESAQLMVRSTGIGHRFPTYSVPRVRLGGMRLGPDRQPLPNGYREIIIQRNMMIENNRWSEISDTRLKPGEMAILSIPWQQGSHCTSAVTFRITVEPEWFYYEKAYPAVLEELEDGPARDLVLRAQHLSRSRNYLLFEETVANTCRN